MEDVVALREVTLPDGNKAYILNNEQLMALGAMLDDRIWMQGAWKRAKRVSVLAGMVIAFLMALASMWPWITRIVQLLAQDVPK